MSLSPFVLRELRLAARKKATFWMRAAPALLPIILLFSAWHSGFRTPMRMSDPVVASQCAGAFLVFSLFAIVLGSDGINSERRHGTLGLLLHTRLSSAEIIGGKFVGLAAILLYNLLASVPAYLGLLFLGAISWTQFWLLLDWLVLSIFLALVAGLLASCLVASAAIALLMALGLLACQAVAPLVLAAAIEGSAGSKATAQAVAALSPLSAISLVLSNPRGLLRGTMDLWLSAQFWLGESVVGLAVASLLTRRARVEGRSSFWWRIKAVLFPRKPAKTALKHGLLWHLRHGSRAKQRAWRRRLLDHNPFYWLTWRDRLLPMLARLIFYAGLLVWLAEALRYGLARGDAKLAAPRYEAWFISAVFLQEIVFKGLLALLTTATLCEARLSGLLETVVLTPASSGMILAGNGEALRRFARLPIILLVLVNVTLFVFGQYQGVIDRGVAGVFFLENALLLVVQYYAIQWWGMRNALRPGPPLQAVLATVLMILFPTWIGLAFFGALLGSPTINFSGIYAVYSVYLSWLLVVLALSVWLIWHSRRALLHRFCSLIQ